MKYNEPENEPKVEQVEKKVESEVLQKEQNVPVNQQSEEQKPVERV